MRLADLVPDKDLGAAGGVEITGVTADSRDVRPGYLFAALPGTRVDGARFIPQALSAGAAAILAGTAAELPQEIDRPVVRDADPHGRLARIAARFAGRQPETVVAVTGTAGKTSVAAFTRQIFSQAGHRAASLGTLGVVTDEGTDYGSLTTPDPVHLHQKLSVLANDGVTHLALEASSHGIDQRRLDGVAIRAAAFTNIGRDHLDYHPTVEAYLAAKLRLFETLLPEDGAVVVDPLSPGGDAVARVAAERGLRLLTVGRSGAALRLLECRPTTSGQTVSIEAAGRVYDLTIPLLGGFQVDNALLSACLAIAVGVPASEALAALESLEGAPGRLELVARTADGAPVFVDYAHKPDALKTVLETLREITDGRLIVVFGAGGDRDRGKRSLMGEVAAAGADVVIVTDDNPRTEEPAAIRTEILAAAPGAQEIGDRREAIRTAIASMGPGDVCVVAGKGHETGQIFGTQTHPFSDADEVREAVGLVSDAAAKPAAPLWTIGAIAQATGGRLTGSDGAVTGISIDTRTLAPGDAFFAIKGDRFDGHAFVSAAYEAGASVAVVSAPVDRPEARAAIEVGDVLQAMGDVGRAARARSQAKVVAVTGSVGKTGTKEALRRALSATGPTHASSASHNNHWGVPLTLSRLSQQDAFGVFEIGMNHAGEITPLTRMVRPHVAVVTTVGPVHIEFFDSVEDIARAKAEIFLGLEPGGVAVVNGDDAITSILIDEAGKAGVDRIVRFGSGADADVRLIACDESAGGSDVTADVFGREIRYRVGAPGRHSAMNSLAVLAAVDLVGADVEKGAAELADLEAGAGRGLQSEIAVPGGTIRLIDDAFNANPSSMRAAFEVLARTPVEPEAKRVAVLGDMFELGDEAPRYHRELSDALQAADIDLVFCAGPLMRNLYDALPGALRGAHADTAADLVEPVRAALTAGDAVLVKGSKASKMTEVVAALTEHAASPSRHQPQG
ncbi:UDP-N-acetylmuramoyl-L-alanyl-D-glutamate--2,6-diaminopimelate ligase [Amorphus orientalis]|uniref:Multifunctional fusion protein n=1 Tax=Amorphus orientalis TaxID=649198 RepID=A0AAE3VPB4_9HYPH|nr:UDP-N-acetylmuramoyl-L-alanyl-D-glutamate--2,6-diaminopimelate ligase [Amorphus orientalis]MDQ0315310.1 UDP-N-acetylmuramyl-tripeptide synthetase/UDP-N-acetylmuramoyl-tripeptide--D-alanyl-D-alanine ligase [Amorphus orientalis]